jgi:hypothetical protein
VMNDTNMKKKETMKRAIMERPMSEKLRKMTYYIYNLLFHHWTCCCGGFLEGRKNFIRIQLSMSCKTFIKLEAVLILPFDNIFVISDIIILA